MPPSRNSFHFTITSNSNLPAHLTRRQLNALINKHLLCSHDVETNPGPPQPQRDEDGVASHGGKPTHQVKTSIRVTSYNVRGLNEEKKLRHLLNALYKNSSGKNTDNFVCLQETYISNPGLLTYLWRGNFHLTPGNGNSCGCITLLSPHLNVIESRDIDNRAHLLVCQNSGDTSLLYIIANLYAPNPNTSGKIDFFERIFDTAGELSELYDCDNLLIAGDFNLVFDESETKNRNYSNQEKRVASCVKDFGVAMELGDVWATNGLRKTFTWKRANSDTFSTIDRILFSKKSLKIESLDTDWSLSCSDHASVTAGFNLVGKKQLPRTKITRLDPSLAKSPETKALLENGFNELLSSMPPDWNPHLKLEFAKMSIRTVCERIQAERKLREKTEEETVNEELDRAIGVLGASNQGSAALIDYVEELRSKKAALVEVKGTRLAERLGSKWYNEGEKSTRYFMRLLNRSAPDNFNNLTTSNGTSISDPALIEAEIVQFYQDLYENVDNIQVNNDDPFFNGLSNISDEERSNVTKPISLEELRETLHSCRDSAPGPDGIPYSIIAALWTTFGPLLTDAWNYSLRIGQLSVSHRTSFLKLIPKVGKDLSKLTNWRPITLSNCDHKIITKAYAKRLCDNLASKIGERQTAYLKGRLINDNLRAMIATVNLSNLENDLKGLIVALDARKAFDSVDHNYIRCCLTRTGLNDFVPIFNTLYRDLRTDIIVNGKIVRGFKINRGVKQGDALSCILFILCMEPLLKNIEHNPEISAINSNLLAKDLPKVYAYADDVNATVKDTVRSLQALFDEYGKLTRISGLVLNAEKTEVLRLGSSEEKEYRISYMNETFNIKSCSKAKINGILFQRNLEEMITENVDNAIKKMDEQFKKWSRRSLSTLGKILIAKTFGVSQIIYLCQSAVITNEHLKRINSVLYKFIWNRHYRAAKAPERIKRAIVNLPTSMGGLGMLDVADLDASLKLRALGRLMKSKHPFMEIVRDDLNLNSFFNPTYLSGIEAVTKKGIELLRKDRNELWENESIDNNVGIMVAVREMGLKEIVTPRGQISINFYMIWRRGSRKVKDLREGDLDSLRNHINIKHAPKIKKAIRLNVNFPLDQLNKSYMINRQLRPLASLTSKEIRVSRSSADRIKEFKIGLRLSEQESASWCLRISKLSSVRHRNTVLRVAHGDVYTQERLRRFGLSNTDRCPRCDEVETLEHRFVSCEYAKRIWREAKKYTRQLIVTTGASVDPVKEAMSALIDHNLEVLTLHAELLSRLISLNPEQQYTIHPKHLVRQAIKSITIREGKQSIKNSFTGLLEN